MCPVSYLEPLERLALGLAEPSRSRPRAPSNGGISGVLRWVSGVCLGQPQLSCWWGSEVGALRSRGSPGCQPQTMLIPRAVPVRAHGWPPCQTAAYRPTMRRPQRVRGLGWRQAAAGSHAVPCPHCLQCSNHRPCHGSGTGRNPFHPRSPLNSECWQWRGMGQKGPRDLTGSH